MRFQFKDMVFQRLGDGTVKAISDVQVTVEYSGTSTLAILYVGPSGGTTKSNPFLTDLGDVDFYVDDEGDYTISFHDTEGTPRIDDTEVAWSPSRPSSPGDMKISPNGTADSGWLLCDGSAVSRTTYSDLFDAIGETFGDGNGTTTFNLPDLAGRSPMGSGSGTGLAPRAVADLVGSEFTTIEIANLPNNTRQAVAVPETSPTNDVVGVDSGAGTNIGGSGTPISIVHPSTVLSFQIRYRK